MMTAVHIWQRWWRVLLGPTAPGDDQTGRKLDAQGSHCMSASLLEDDLYMRG